MVFHAADDGAGAHRLGEFARQPGVDAGLHAFFVAEYVVDEPFAVFDRQQPLFGGVVADADHHAVEEIQRLFDQRGVAACERVERPGEYGCPFHNCQRC